jgi:type IV pilus assembly protein PilA
VTDKIAVKSRPHSVTGFTLIEIMIVIAIVSVLVALAVPAYQEYVVRAKVTECIAAAAVPKLQIAEYKQVTGSWPSNASQAGVDEFEDWGGQDRSQFCHLTFDAAKYASWSSAPLNLVIWVNTQSMLSSPEGKQIAPFLTPIAGNGRGWKCTVGWTFPSEVKYLPSQCRGENVR